MEREKMRKNMGQKSFKMRKREEGKKNKEKKERKEKAGWRERKMPQKLKETRTKGGKHTQAGTPFRLKLGESISLFLLTFICVGPR